MPTTTTQCIILLFVLCCIKDYQADALNLARAHTVQHNNTGPCEPDPKFGTSECTGGICPSSCFQAVVIQTTPLFSLSKTKEFCYCQSVLL